MSTALSSHWKFFKNDYKLLSIIGEGSYGQVVKAINRKTKQTHAIKCLKIENNDVYKMKSCIREIQILKKLSSIKENVYAVKLWEVKY